MQSSVPNPWPTLPMTECCVPHLGLRILRGEPPWTRASRPVDAVQLRIAVGCGVSFRERVELASQENVTTELLF